MEKTEMLTIKESAFCVPFVKWQESNQDKEWVEKLSKTLKWNKRIIQKPLTRAKGKERRAKL